MKLYRIWGIFLRYYYNLLHSYDRLSDMFFWPLMDLLLWGLTSRYIVAQGTVDNRVILTLLGGIMLWIFPWRGQYEMTVNFLEDLWNRNLVNLFATPVRFSEWVVTLMLVGIFKASVSFVFASLVAYLLYATNIYSLGPTLLPWVGILIMFGWVVGLIVTSIIMRFGTKIQTFAWIGINILAPFVGVYYSVSTLPAWAQAVAQWIPASYAFEAMRRLVMGQGGEYTGLAVALGLNGLYLILGLGLLYTSYRTILKRGLISVT